jgi:hypothetical protein
MIERLAWVSTAAARGQDLDEPIALAALAAAGVGTDVVDWHDPGVDWSGYDRVVLRSTWDYDRRVPEFLAWLQALPADCDLRNPERVVRWSLDKRYLAELDRAGVPITPTQFLEPGDEPVLAAGELFVKPAIGAGSRDAASYSPPQHALAVAHVLRLHAREVTALVQPLLKSIAEEGEWALMFFGGQFSHAVNKRVALPAGKVIEELFAAETITGHVADEAQLAVARGAIDVVTSRFGPTTYARVDLVRDDDGNPCVLELELIEPSLFLTEAPPGAVDRFVQTLVTAG